MLIKVYNNRTWTWLVYLIKYYRQWKIAKFVNFDLIWYDQLVIDDIRVPALLLQGGCARIAKISGNIFFLIDFLILTCISAPSGTGGKLFEHPSYKSNVPWLNCHLLYPDCSKKFLMGKSFCGDSLFCLSCNTPSYQIYLSISLDKFLIQCLITKLPAWWPPTTEMIRGKGKKMKIDK